MRSGGYFSPWTDVNNRENLGLERGCAGRAVGGREGTGICELEVEGYTEEEDYAPTQSTTTRATQYSP
jgi:hypothetical protein